MARGFFRALVRRSMMPAAKVGAGFKVAPCMLLGLFEWR